MTLKQIIGLAVSVLGLGVGIWLALFPTNYLRANVKYKSPKSWLSVGEAESPRWQLAFRLLGFAVLAFTAVYVYSILRPTH